MQRANTHKQAHGTIKNEPITSPWTLQPRMTWPARGRPCCINCFHAVTLERVGGERRGKKARVPSGAGGCMSWLNLAAESCRHCVPGISRKVKKTWSSSSTHARKRPLAISRLPAPKAAWPAHHHRIKLQRKWSRFFTQTTTRCRQTRNESSPLPLWRFARNLCFLSWCWWEVRNNLFVCTSLLHVSGSWCRTNLLFLTRPLPEYVLCEIGGIWGRGYTWNRGYNSVNCVSME